MNKWILVLLIASLSSISDAADITLTSVGENIESISDEATIKSKKISLLRISNDGSRAVIRYLESLNMNKYLKKLYLYSSDEELVELTADPDKTVILTDRFIAYTPNENSYGGFVYETDSGRINVSPSDIPTDFLSNYNHSTFHEIQLTSNYGNSGVIGVAIGAYSGNGRVVFKWSPESGFVNPMKDIPICNWNNCYLNLESASDSGLILGGSIQGQGLIVDSHAGEKVLIERNGYDYSSVINLSENGELAIVAYSPNLRGLYDVKSKSLSYLDPIITYNWFTGTTENPVKLVDLDYYGNIGVGSAGGQAIMWTKENGARSLSQHLVANYNVDLNGWTLTSATHISDDGTVIYGAGRSPSGHTGPWKLALNNSCVVPTW